MFLCKLILSLTAVFFVNQIALAAKVRAISKKRSMVKVNAGVNKGYFKGAKVCIYRKKKKVACGKVIKVKPTSSFVKVSKKRLKRIKKGMRVRLRSKARRKATEMVEEGIGKGKEAMAQSSSGTDHRTNLKLNYFATILAPAVYEKITYAAPEIDTATNQEVTSVDTLWQWQSDSTASLSILGFGAESEFGIGKSMAISVGLRLRFYRDFISPADYNKTVPEQFVETEISAQAFGLYSDFTFLDIAMSESLFWRLSSGLDIDMSTVKLTATQKDDDSSDTTEIASTESKLTVLSLRLGTNFNFMVLEPIGIVFGTNLLIPITTFSASASTENNDPNATSKLSGGDGQADLDAALDHRKAGFGAEVVLGAYFAF